MSCLAPPSLSPPSPSPTLETTQQQLLSTLKYPQTPKQLKTLHAHILKTGLNQNDLILGQLLLCCSISNSMDYARQVFDKIPNPKLFFWNAMLKGYSETGAHNQALLLYNHMRTRSIHSDAFTLPVVLKSCSYLARMQEGKEIHGLVMKTGFDSEVIVQTALIDMYCSTGFSTYARQVFDRMPEPDTICWNTMIAGHIKCGDFVRAQELFDLLPSKNVSSWNTLLDMYCKTGDLGTARKLFDEMSERDVISWNAIITGYAKTGDFGSARELFDAMPKRNVVSWNVVITCYVHNRRFLEALDLFQEMQYSDVRPNQVTIVAILPACAHLGALDLGQWIHSYIDRNRIKKDVYINTSLIDMYGKCGSIDDAKRVFDTTSEKDAFLCSTMIEVFAMNGKAEKAFEVFSFMRSARIKPNDVTFVGLLKACSHVGLVDEGLNFFDTMSKEFGLMPKLEHYGCVIDLLGRAGFLNEARELIERMPMEPHAIIWGSLLSACRIHGNVELAEETMVHLLELEPRNCGNYVLLSNIYSKANRWDDAAKVRKLMKEKGVVKKPGCSSIEVKNTVYEFFAGDRSHPQSREIYETVNQIAMRLKKEGYEPQTTSVLHDMDDDGKEQALIHHSEKLAVAFGLLTASQGAPIRIVKNLRVCEDCHLFLKMFSKLYNKQINVRDCNRFHHFSEGSCSCSDYW